METEELSSGISKTSSVEMPIAGGLEPTKPISFLGLFRFCTASELFLLFIGFVMSAIKALTLPAVVIIYSEFTAMLVDRTLRIGTSSQTHCLPIFGGGKILTNASIEENNRELYNDSISYGILLTLASIVMLISGIISVDIFNLIALRQVTRIRIKLFESVMRQDIGWHDLASKHNFTQNMIDDAEKIRDGISEKVAHFIYLIIGFIVTVGISFGYGWRLTLAVSVYIPIVIVLNYFVAKFQSKLTMREQECYAAAGNLAEEVLTAIRTVMAFGGELKECRRYNNMLIPARKASQRKGAFAGFSDAVLKSMLFLTCAGAFWYGVNLIVDDRYTDDKEYTPAILMIAFFGIIIGADNIARTSPFLESFAIARGSATTLFRVIANDSKIDPLSTDGKILNYGLRGDVDLVDVFFRYPARPDVVVHRGLNISIKAGTTVALVGPSGCGKSTCLQLLQRFYDPVFGSILLDGLDIRKYNTQWLRSNMAIVGQEPVLFMGTIADNISYGMPRATQKDIETAAKAAGVHDFISNLPQSYKTMIGERGCQLSGGQKQRIAIARALIQKPKILLLDEATSALDYEAEKLVQDALDLAAKGRTTIVISHRLSAIRNADKIVFMHDGHVLEEGIHDDLMTLEGAYYQMVKAGDLNTSPDMDHTQETNEGNLENSLAIYEKSFETSPVNLGRSKTTMQNLAECNLSHPNHINHENDMENVGEPEENQNDKKCKEVEANFFVTFGRILRLAKPEMYFLIIGGICAILYGFTYPLFSIAFGEFYAALAEVDEQKALNRTAVLSIWCVVLSVLTALSSFLQTYLFNYAGVWLTTRLRSSTFKSMMAQELAWYDDTANSVGILSARLSGDAAGVQGAIGYPLSAIIQALSNFILGLILAFYYSWKLALLCLCTCPVIIGSVIFEAKFMSMSLMREKKVLEKASRIATEAITNIRTIAGLRREQHIINEYNKEMQQVQNLIREKLKYRGVINATGQAFLFFAYAVALCYGGVLVSEGKIDFQDIIKVSETLLYGFMMLAQSLAFAPSFTAALVAGHRLFEILDRRQRQTSQLSQSESRESKAATAGNNKPRRGFDGVRYQDVSFRYPTRNELKVLTSFSLDIQRNQSVGLVGHSGSGKSTCLQLLQRFYEPNRGNIYINDYDINAELSVENVRSKLGIVAQEPVLFARTIADNIAYGDNKRELSRSEIIAAAKTANAHGFITSLPNGYETKIGSHGSHLSGGQKQRIAIARALVRNPQILLLDEATSALDVQSEQLVQQALDVATAGRTCIIIAHRLSSIQKLDLICVLDKGSIVEQGTHQELLARNGIYAKLYNVQRRTVPRSTRMP